MSAETVIQCTAWDGPYLGNFMLGQLALAERVHDELGLRTHFVLGSDAARQPWVAELEQPHLSHSVPPAGRPALARHLAEVVSQHPPALVHSHFTQPDLPAQAAAHRAGAPCVWHMHTGFEGYPARQRLKDLLRIRLIGHRRVARIVAVSPWIGALARRRGARAEQVVVIPNAIAMERFDELPDRAESRAQLGLPADGPVALALVWWPEAKGADLLLDALEQLHARGAAPTALLVGEDALHDLVAERGLTDAPWLRLSRFVPDPRVLYAAADVFVCSSRHEGQSYAVGEALACGLPTVLTEIPGNSAYLPAPRTVAVPPRDVPALAAGIVQAVAEADSDGRRDEQVAAWARAELGLAAWCDRLVAVYGELVAPRA